MMTMTPWRTRFTLRQPRQEQLQHLDRPPRQTRQNSRHSWRNSGSLSPSSTRSASRDVPTMVRELEERDVLPGIESWQKDAKKVTWDCPGPAKRPLLQHS